MSDEFNIELGVEVNKNSVENSIEKILKSISDKVGKIETNIEANESSIQNIVKSLNDKVGKVEVDLELKKDSLKDINKKANDIEVNVKVGNDFLKEINNKLEKFKPKPISIPPPDTEAAEKKISRFKDDIQVKLNGIKIDNLSEIDTTAINNLNEEINSLSKETENVDQKMRDIKKTYTTLVNDINRGRITSLNLGSDVNLVELQNQLSIWKEKPIVVRQLSDELIKSGVAWRTFTADAKNADGTFTRLGGSINLATGEVRVKEKEMQNLNKTTKNLSQSVVQLTKYYLSLSTVIRMLTSAFSEMKEIDSHLTNLSKVTDLTRDSFQEASIEAAKAANLWGRTASDALEAQTVFARIGAENYKQLAELSLLAQAAGDMSAELASQYLVASNAAFRLENDAEKLGALLDSQNQVSNRAAITMTEMANATRVYGNTAVVAGESAQTMTALITAGVASTTKSGDVIGRALRSISMNIRQIKGKLCPYVQKCA